MKKLMARAGKGLTYRLPETNVMEEGESGSEDDDDEEDEEEKKEDEKPFEPLMVWQSPHNGGESLGLPKVL